MEFSDSWVSLNINVVKQVVTTLNPLKISNVGKQSGKHVWQSLRQLWGQQWQSAKTRLRSVHHPTFLLITETLPFRDDTNSKTNPSFRADTLTWSFHQTLNPSVSVAFHRKPVAANYQFAVLLLFGRASLVTVVSSLIPESVFMWFHFGQWMCAGRATSSFLGVDGGLLELLPSKIQGELEIGYHLVEKVTILMQIVLSPLLLEFRADARTVGYASIWAGLEN